MITLKPIKITYKETFSYPIEDYLEYCSEQELSPSQRHYEELSLEEFENSLRDDISQDNMTIKQGKPKQYDFELPTVKNFEFESHSSLGTTLNTKVEEVLESEAEELFDLIDQNKVTIIPQFSKLDKTIIMLKTEQNLEMTYGMKIDSETGDILCLKKSDFKYGLFVWLQSQKWDNS